MRKFIVLTHRDGKKICMNIRHIAHFSQNENETAVKIADHIYYVSETTQQILDQING